MRTSSFRYLVAEGVRGMLANRLMALASIGVLTACLLLIGGAWLLTENVNSVIGHVEDQSEAMVFVADDIDTEGILEIEQQLWALENIHEVIFVSKEQALTQQQDMLQDNAYLFEEFQSDNPYPNSFRLKIDDLSRQEETLERVMAIEGTDGVSASADLAATITDIKSGISFAGIFIVGILSLVSLVIVTNTIKITVFSRRKEINIMKYVGATDLFIRMPFLVEGILLGLISAGLAFLFLWGGYFGVTHWMSEAGSSWVSLAFTNLVQFSDVAPMIIATFAAAGVGIGVVGSMMFIGRFLKV